MLRARAEYSFLLGDTDKALKDLDGVLVAPGFGERGIEGKIRAIQHVREQNIPFFGICLGMQVAVIEYARHVLGITDADSSEFNEKSENAVIALITEWQDQFNGVQARSKESDLGGTMRLGAQEALLVPGSLAARSYGAESVMERHRHRYEFNNNYLEKMSEAGMVFSGRSADGLVEIIELPDHPWFLASQFHPEFTSTPRDGHPLFSGFVSAARRYREQLDA